MSDSTVIIGIDLCDSTAVIRGGTGASEGEGSNKSDFKKCHP
jgi:hypothetical protein